MLLHVDFEIAARETAKIIFLGIKIMRCRFHLGQA